jgi:hypothetical protein
MLRYLVKKKNGLLTYRKVLGQLAPIKPSKYHALAKQDNWITHNINGTASTNI